MRLFIMVLLAFSMILGVVSKAPVEAAGSRAGVLSSSVSDAQNQPVSILDVEIGLNKGAGGQWSVNPMWMAIGGLAMVVFIALIVMAARGGGTTVIKG